ncbi:MAG: coenzyme F420-0:L-glutamate ligase [Nitrososphaerota archaeon]|nr:coenzyme F420-0:L-glutamate ligase [Nitrososphaerota archaeon]MDG7049293.1 coenzyme F420-0:L-glutamate ligase [Nitrososphaerota archaeon]MDG7050988.1 coenzyme F420-0:L-glutamate ligase [Nitrososphaerota archaeon]
MERMDHPFDIWDNIRLFLKKVGVTIRDGDILVLSGKYSSMSTGRKYNINDVIPLADSIKIADKANVDAKLAELVIRESDAVYSSMPGFLMAVNNGLLAPNGGLDRSNVERNEVILYPISPNEMSESIRRRAFIEYQTYIGVLITDSRLYPMRKGTVGISIGSSGIRAIIDDRGREDLFNNKLKVTKRAIADDIATIAQLSMGESNEGRPIVLIRGLKDLVEIHRRPYNLSVSFEEDIYTRMYKKLV